jgi:hypothetical protein
MHARRGTDAIAQPGEPRGEELASALLCIAPEAAELGLEELLTPVVHHSLHRLLRIRRLLLP